MYHRKFHVMENSCQPLRELSLFSGCGGGILGSLLLGHKIIGAVEFNEYCCRVLEQRQRDGILERFPIFQTDIRDFIRNGYAELYKGHCDLISAGFPCQPFSIAGKQLGEYDDRNMFPETAECIRIIRPKYVFLENVAAITSNEYFGTILSTLSQMGYWYRWGTLGGETINNVIDGKRIWIFVSSSNSKLLEIMDVYKNFFAYSQESRRRQYTGAISAMLSQDDYSRIKRNSDVVSAGMDRLKAIGNSQLPFLAATAWNLIAGTIE